MAFYLEFKKRKGQSLKENSETIEFLAIMGKQDGKRLCK